MASHGRRSVVNHNQNRLALIVNHVQQTSYAGMEERRIADDANDGPFFASLHHAMRHRETTAHAQDCIRAGQRWEDAQAVAANVARHDHIVFCQTEENAAMRATRAQHRRTPRQIIRIRNRRCDRNFRTFKTCLYTLNDDWRQFAATRDDVFAIARDTERLHMLFQNRIAFFNHGDTIHTRRKITNQFVRERPRPAKLQHGGFREGIQTV